MITLCRSNPGFNLDTVMNNVIHLKSRILSLWEGSSCQKIVLGTGTCEETHGNVSPVAIAQDLWNLHTNKPSQTFQAPMEQEDSEAEVTEVQTFWAIKRIDLYQSIELNESKNKVLVWDIFEPQVPVRHACLLWPIPCWKRTPDWPKHYMTRRQGCLQFQGGWKCHHLYHVFWRGLVGIRR